MNPFSGFLQPMNHRPLTGMATTQDIVQGAAQRREEKQRALENTQKEGRANAYLQLQQADQAKRFGDQDQKQIEALLAEYQDAEDQGDAVRLSRAAQMLQRHGMELSSGGAKPDLRALTGETLLPQTSRLDLAAFTGQQGVANPIDEAVSTEMKSRDALRARNAENLSQEDFETQLINETQDSPGRYEQDGQTTEAFRSKLPQAPDDEPVDMGDVDSPEFQRAAQSEVIDLDAEKPAPLQVGEPQREQVAQQSPPRLATQLLPTVVSKGGKKLYESTGPSGRWTPMVSSVFEPFLAHENPEIAAAAKRSQAVTEKLISVDGIAPKDAIKMGMDYLNQEATRVTNLERTKLGTKPRWGTGGAAPGKFTALGPKEDRAESIKLYITEARGAVSKLNESDRLLAQAEALANSPDPALQRNAIDILVQSRSGATVSDRERARYDQLDGAISQAQNYIARWSGGQLDPSYVNKIKMVIAEQRRINAATREEVAADLEEAYAAQNEGKVAQPILERRQKALGKTIRQNVGSDSGGEELWE